MLRELRKARQLTGQQVAIRLGVHFTLLSRIENGHHLPSPDLLREWGKVLGADQDLLFCAFGMVPPDLADALTRNPQLCRDIRALLTPAPQGSNTAA
jgi:transcriptional regulator with XRE-family HTH domain